MSHSLYNYILEIKGIVGLHWSDKFQTSPRIMNSLQMERTLLMIAAHGGCSEIVSILIKYGADVNQQDVRICIHLC